jgi:hypothetical protein
MKEPQRESAVPRSVSSMCGRRVLLILLLLRDSTHFNDFHGDPELKFQLWMHDAEAKADLATFFVYRLFVGCYISSI